MQDLAAYYLYLGIFYIMIIILMLILGSSSLSECKEKNIQDIRISFFSKYKELNFFFAQLKD